MRIVRAFFYSNSEKNVDRKGSWLTVSILVEKMESLSEFRDLGLSELRHRRRIREGGTITEQREASSRASEQLEPSSSFFFLPSSLFLLPSSGVPRRVHTCPDRNVFTPVRTGTRPHLSGQEVRKLASIAMCARSSDVLEMSFPGLLC
jgi:hypothetical protein